MQLLTQEIRNKLPPLHGTEGVADPLVICKFYMPMTKWVWYAIEFDGMDTFYGYVVGFRPELGYFNLSSLEQVEGPFSLTIERDMYFESKQLSLIKQLHNEK